MKEARKNFSQVGLIYAGMLLAVTSIQLVVTGVFNDYCPEFIENFIRKTKEC